MKHLYLIRHGEAELNTQNFFAGQTETPLTDKGRAQARLAGIQAKDLHIDHIISSPLSRAYDTAHIIAEEIGYPAEKIAVSDLLMERNFGSAEGTPWSPDFNMEAVPDAEPLTDLESRTRQLWQQLQDTPAENLLVVTHGSTGRMLRSIARPEIPFEAPDKSQHLPNAQIVQLI